MDSFINRLAFGCNSWRILGINHRKVKITSVTTHSLCPNFSLIWRITLNNWASHCRKALISWPRPIGLFTCHRISWDFTRKFNRLGHIIIMSCRTIFVDVMDSFINRLAFGCNSWRILGINHREVKITRISVDSLNCNVCQIRVWGIITDYLIAINFWINYFCEIGTVCFCPSSFCWHTIIIQRCSLCFSWVIRCCCVINWISYCHKCNWICRISFCYFFTILVNILNGFTNCFACLCVRWCIDINNRPIISIFC